MLELVMTLYAILLLLYMVHVIRKVTKLRREDREAWQMSRAVTRAVNKKNNEIFWKSYKS